MGRALLEKDHDIIRDEAREFMRRTQERCVEFDPDRKVTRKQSIG